MESRGLKGVIRRRYNGLIRTKPIGSPTGDVGHRLIQGLFIDRHSGTGPAGRESDILGFNGDDWDDPAALFVAPDPDGRACEHRLAFDGVNRARCIAGKIVKSRFLPVTFELLRTALV
jgi:hypothetical protein